VSSKQLRSRQPQCAGWSWQQNQESVDVTAADTLAELDEALRAAGIELCYTELKDPVKDKLKRFGLFPLIGEGSFFPTIGAAVGN
jgi:MFS superfamily sulfate permease-like transporter